MAFFQGSGKLDSVNDELRASSALDGVNDAVAKKIALQGKEWTQKFWRKEDMVAYMFR